MLGTVAEAANDDPRQAVLALESDEMAGKGDRLENEPPGLVRGDLAPVLRARVGKRSLADTEVFGALRIGGDDQLVAMMFDGVLVTVLTGQHAARGALGLFGVDEVDL